MCERCIDRMWDAGTASKLLESDNEWFCMSVVAFPPPPHPIACLSLLTSLRALAVTANSRTRELPKVEGT